MIEAALSESERTGYSDTSGAAVMTWNATNIPCESKIRTLRINKNRFQNLRWGMLSRQS